MDAPAESVEEDGREEEEDDDESMLQRARGGLMELFVVGGWVVREPSVLDEVGGRRSRLALVAAGLLAAGLGANALALWVPAEIQAAGSWHLVDWLLHPVLLPAVALGLYLRGNVGYQAERRHRAREGTRAQALAMWDEAAPQVVVVYALAALAVALLSLARLRGEEFGEEVWVEDTARSLVVCAWVLSPIAHTERLRDALGPAFESAIGAIVSLLVMQITLWLSSMGASILVAILKALLPLPPAPIEGVGVLLEIAAELGFLGLMLGYTYEKEREHFVERLMAVEEDGESESDRASS